MDLMQIRRGLLAQAMQTEPELYPVETDICDLYGLKSNATSRTSIDTATGELISTSTAAQRASVNYAEINPRYTYAKKEYRLYVIAYYDADKNYIGYTTSLNSTTEGTTLQNIPSNAKYVRMCMYKSSASNWNNVGLVRTA